MSLYDFSQLIGIIGVGIGIISYFLLQIRYIKVEGYEFSLLNLIASIFIMFSLIFSWNLSAFLQEVFWAMISLIGFFMYFKRKKCKKNKISKN